MKNQTLQVLNTASKPNSEPKTETRKTRRYIMAIDQGTSSSRVILYDEKARMVAAAQKKLQQSFPQSGWVEHDGEEIWQSVREMMQEALFRAAIDWGEVAALGLTNQRETVLLWDKFSGRPVAPAIVWQCRRTADYCRRLKEEGHEPLVKARTGLPLDAYFSASKLRWLLDSAPDIRARAERGELLAGTVDSWLIWKLSGGRQHVTDVSNASRTQLLNLQTRDWDPVLLELFDIPKILLPNVVASSGRLAEFAVNSVDDKYGSQRIPITGVAGDQQAALFGQTCFEAGMVKCTYGTGCFLLLNTGRKIIHSEQDLLTTLAWDIGDGPVYALEGSVFNAGSVIQWLRDALGLIQSAQECDRLAASVTDSGGVHLVPAFTGLGAPYWESGARGVITGLSRASGKAELCRAVIESIAFQTADICLAMRRELGEALSEIRVDGGASQSDVLMQFQADLLNLPLLRPSSVETTALGAAFLAGLGAGFWSGTEELRGLLHSERQFHPSRDEDWREQNLAGWRRAVRSALFEAHEREGER